MSSHTASVGFGLQSLRTLLHLPQGARPQAAAIAPRGTPWLERLAAWAERQPMHHHMGSCRWL